MPPSASSPDNAIPPERLTAGPPDDSRGSFLRMVSHELRTPLNSIIGFSELLGQEMFGPLGAPQYREYAQHIGASGYRLLKLVNQIMDIVRLESGAERFDVAPESLGDAVEDAFETLRAEAQGRQIALVAEAPGAMPSVLADHRALRTILANLLQNAVTHSPPGMPVRVRAQSQEGWVKLQVEDFGAGVDAAEIPRLMQPFEQGQHALIRTSAGVGLGLPITRLLCEAMGGSLDIRSPPGAGLTAVVSLRAARTAG
jgi:signal transduction histidine kinase